MWPCKARSVSRRKLFKSGCKKLELPMGRRLSSFLRVQTGLHVSAAAVSVLVAFLRDPFYGV